jgi:hypothetical protein
MQPATTRLALTALAFVFVLAATDARAQYVAGPALAPTVTVSYGTPGGIPAANYTYAPSYSYWTAAYYGYPPRIYVGLGAEANDFPYYGQPYGSPSDPWSWSAMAGYAAGIPTRYYVVLP